MLYSHNPLHSGDFSIVNSFTIKKIFQSFCSDFKEFFLPKRIIIFTRFLQPSTFCLASINKRITFHFFTFLNNQINLKIFFGTAEAKEKSVVWKAERLVGKAYFFLSYVHEKITFVGKATRACG